MLKAKVVKHRIEAFEKRLGKPHLYLAYHAAFPLSLTPDLLYRIWANFKQDSQGQALDIPWIAVADVLISPLCAEVGYELYEMDSQVREELLKRLKADPKFGPKRIEELSAFLLAYIQPHLESEDPDILELAQVQQWTALAYTAPDRAAVKMAQRLAQIDPNAKLDFIWMESLIKTLETPLKKFSNLVRYAQGMGSYGRGDLETATEFLMEVPAWGNKCLVAGVPLSVPEAIQTSRAWRRRRLLKFALYILLGCGGISGAYWLYRKSLGITVKQFKASVVRVNKKGEKTKPKSYPIKFFSEALGNGVELDMVYIPGGSFNMGSPEDEKGRSKDEGPQHRVKVSTFFISRYPVTQAQWRAIASLPKVDIDLKADPSRFKGDNRPVETVSWFEAVEFCKRLRERTGREYRLPSEAEWEYACRAGTTTPFHFGETITGELANYAASETYADEPKGEYRRETTPVGQFPPNAFGLSDMHGNVWEWCEDTWHDNYEDAPTDGSAWLDKNDNRSQYSLLRGGSWDVDPGSCRCGDRNNDPPDNHYNFIGVRVVAAARILFPFFL